MANTTQHCRSFVAPKGHYFGMAAYNNLVHTAGFSSLSARSVGAVQIAAQKREIGDCYVWGTWKAGDGTEKFQVRAYLGRIRANFRLGLLWT